MGRGRNNTGAVVMTGFDTLVGGRRGIEAGNLLASNPTPADRTELERLFGPVDRGHFEAATQLLAEHHAKLGRLPLLAELHERVCRRLVVEAKRHHTMQSERALHTFGFTPDHDKGLLLSDPARQEKMDAELAEEAKRRTSNLLKVGQPITAKAADVAFEGVFVKYAAAQCFRDRERLCQKHLGRAVPPNLVEVSAWRAMLKQAYDGSVRNAAELMVAAKPTDKRPPEEYRRRQRFVR